MTNVNLQDALLIYIITFIIGLVLMLFISLKYKNKINGLGYFNLFFISNVLGMTGIYFRNDLSYFTSIILANLVLMIASIFLLYGILKFLNKKIPRIQALVFSVIYVGLFLYFTYGDFNVSLRIAVYGVSIMLIQGYCLYILYKNSRINNNEADLFSSIITVYLFTHLFRIIGLLFSQSPSTFFDFNDDSINIILLGIVGSIFTIGILSMINTKFMNDIIEGESSFNYLVENIPVPAMIHNREGKMLKLSKTLTDLTGFSIKDIPNVKSWTKFAYRGKKVTEIREIIKGLYLNKDTIKTNEQFVLSKDEEKLKWIFHSGYLGKNSKGEEMAISVALDITESSRLKDSLTMSEKRSALAQDIARVGSYEIDLITKKVWASKVAFEIYELDNKNEDLDLSVIQSMRDKADNDYVDKALENLIEKNIPYEITFRINTKNCKLKHIHSRAILIKDSKGIPLKVVGVFQDVTSLKENEAKLEYSAYNDYLTGLHNRRYYEENLLLMDKQENYPLTIAMADINGLKLINDAFGHSSGDDLLVSAAKLLSNETREFDILARIGGDEFVIVMPKTTEAEAEEIINTINKKSKDIFIQSIELSISFGYKAKIKHSEDIQDIYRSAEDLMYREKLLEIPSMRSGAIEAILSTLYEKDKGSEVHSRSVSLFSERLATFYGMDRQNIQEVKTAGILHDIGKIIIPTDILQKEGKLTIDEYETIKNHSEIGFRILNSTSDMRNISDIILNHHERWDGKGYPRGIRAEEIPVKSRIISIADAFDAMTSERSYRKIVSKEEALNELVLNSGTQFDPKLVELFKEHLEEIVKD